MDIRYQQVGDSKVYLVESPKNQNKQLKVATYVLEFDADRGEFFIEEITTPTLPDKVYGVVYPRVNKIINTYNDKPAQMGVTLAGLKGTGKSLLINVLNVKLQEQGVSTIIINKPYKGDKFNIFMQKLPSCMVVFDEYEKTYFDYKDQEGLLTLLDGAYQTKKLFVFAVNKTNITEYMQNRPGRVYYRYVYKGLDNESIIAYCEDKLKDELKQHIPSICNLSLYVKDINFDMLKAIVEEMNRYNYTPNEALEDLNIEREHNNKSFICDITIDDEPVMKYGFRDRKSLHGSPIQGIYFDLEKRSEVTRPDGKVELDYEEMDVMMSPEDMVKMDVKNNIFIFEKDIEDLGKMKVKLKEQPVKEFSWTL